MSTRVAAGSDGEIRTGPPATQATPANAGATVPVLTVPEVAVGALVLILAVVAWMSLLLADNHRHSLPAVLGCSLVVLALIGLLCWAFGGRVRVSADPWTLLVLAVTCVVAGFFFVPGFHYAVTDKDPGVYVAHAIQIARGGSYSFHDTVLQRVPDVALTSPGARFPGVWIGDQATQTIVPQFYHLWPALLATAFDVHGWGALTLMGPLVGVLAVLALTVTLRRVFGPLVALAGGLLLATNMLEVWQAKYPTTEILAQLLYVGTLLGVVVALRTGWRPAAGFAGLLLGIGWLCRPDTVLLIALAAGIGAVLVALRCWDARCWWFLAGFAVVVPHALWQAYAGAAKYTATNNVPSLPTLAVGCLGLFAAGLLLRFTATPLIDRITGRLSTRHVQARAGFALCAVAAVLLVVGLLRPRLFGVSYTNYNGTIIRSYDEHSLVWLSWFVTLPGLALMGLGLAVVALRRWRAAAWALVIPTLVIMPIYAYRMRNSPRLMWATRRWVPIVLPGIMLLIAVAIVFAVLWGYRGRVKLLAAPGVAAFGLLLAAFVSQSAPLRHHDEFAGSYQTTARIAALAGNHAGVFIFAPEDTDRSGLTHLFGGAMWLERDQYSALLPNTPADHTRYVRQFLNAFPGAPVFVVSEGALRPADLTGIRLTPVLHQAYTLPFWQESSTQRPDHETPLSDSFTVWRVEATPRLPSG